MSELDRKIHEWLFPAIREPEHPFDGTADTLPRSFGDMGAPDYSWDGGAMLRLIAAVSKKGYGLTMATGMDGKDYVATLDGPDFEDIETLADTLPMAVALAVEKLIEAADPPPQAEGQGEVYNPMCGCGHRSGQHVRGYPVTKTRFCMAGGCGCNSFQPPSVEDKSKAAE